MVRRTHQSAVLLCFQLMRGKYQQMFLGEEFTKRPEDMRELPSHRRAFLCKRRMEGLGYTPLGIGLQGGQAVAA